MVSIAVTTISPTIISITPITQSIIRITATTRRSLILDQSAQLAQSAQYNIFIFDFT